MNKSSLLMLCLLFCTACAPTREQMFVSKTVQSLRHTFPYLVQASFSFSRDEHSQINTVSFCFYSYTNLDKDQCVFILKTTAKGITSSFNRDPVLHDRIAKGPLTIDRLHLGICIFPVEGRVPLESIALATLDNGIVTAYGCDERGEVDIHRIVYQAPLSSDQVFSGLE